MKWPLPYDRKGNPFRTIKPLLDRVTFWYLAAIALAGLLYISFQLTPSSYGVVLQQLRAPNSRPLAGASRIIRADEWGLTTPDFQAAVRNRFQRINETSFYREDLRTFDAVPLADWGLAFKPQMWAFFLAPPAIAFSIHHALLMCAFLAGFHLLFRQLGVPPSMAAAASLMLFFSGFVQFWWTSYGLLAFLPWVTLIVLQPMRWWKKALLCAWAFPALALAHLYPTLLLTLAWGVLILILAVRPSLLRSPGDIAAIAAGMVATIIVVYFYYGDLIAIMRNTVYPGQRVSPSGGTNLVAVLSEIFPLVSFRLRDYQNLSGPNICEIGAVGTFLPLLTLCVARYRALRDHRQTRTALLVLLAGFTAITLWEIAPVPAWIGKILLWNTGPAERWMFMSGFLLTVAALLVWTNNLVTLSPFRLALFALVGLFGSVILKTAALLHHGQPAASLIGENVYDLLLCAVPVAAGIASWYLPAASRASVLLASLAVMNVYAFARFNPLQPAGPIFEVPETALFRELQKEAASTDGILIDGRFYGSTLNGLGFRAAAQIVMAPRLDLFRQYFPTMDPDRFNVMFNRYATIRPTQKPMPVLLFMDEIDVPSEVFVPVRNVRRLESGPARKDGCSLPADGGIGEVSAQDPALVIVGWAPWQAETNAQGIRVLCARPLRTESLTTVTRPDIAEQVQDYRMVKSGFRLAISSTDGKPLQPKEVTILAFGTTKGDIRLACCGCPAPNLPNKLSNAP